MNQERLEITVAGSAGSAVGEAETRRTVIGRFEGVILKYTDQPATCVVTLTEAETELVIGTVTGNSDGIFQLTRVGQTSRGADIATNRQNRNFQFPCYDRIKVAVTLGDPGQVDVKLRWK